MNNQQRIKDFCSKLDKDARCGHHGNLLNGKPCPYCFPEFSTTKGQEPQSSPFNTIIIPTLLGAIAGSGKFDVIENKFPELKYRLTGYTSDGFYFGGYYSDPMGCTLLARSVDSMTDAELMSFGTSYDEDELDEARIHVSFTRNVDDVLQMLSIRVLPKYIADLLPMKVEWV